MMTPRTTPRWTRDRPVTRYCQRSGCGVATRAGKPFCSAHVEDHPYVRGLLSLIAEMRSEAALVRVRGARAVDTRALSSQEILRFLRVHGERSVPRLARDLNIPLEILEFYVKALGSRNLVALRENKRGATLISYGQQGRRRRSSKQAADPASLHDVQGTMETAG